MTDRTERNDTMDFGDVIKEMKAHSSQRFAREAWYPRDACVFLTKGRTVRREDWVGSMPKGVKGDVRICSHIDMKTADGRIVIGWSPSQIEMLADDWYKVVDDESATDTAE